MKKPLNKTLMLSLIAIILLAVVIIVYFGVKNAGMAPVFNFKPSLCPPKDRPELTKECFTPTLSSCCLNTQICDTGSGFCRSSSCKDGEIMCDQFCCKKGLTCRNNFCVPTECDNPCYFTNEEGEKLLRCCLKPGQECYQNDCVDVCKNNEERCYSHSEHTAICCSNSVECLYDDRGNPFCGDKPSAPGGASGTPAGRDDTAR